MNIEQFTIFRSPAGPRRKRGAPSLVAEIIAARTAADERTERDARRQLKGQFGVNLMFGNEMNPDEEVQRDIE